MDELDGLVNNDAIPKDDRILRSAKLSTRLTELERKRHHQNRETMYMRNRIEGKIICKSWTKANKEAKPRDMIYALRKNETPNQQVNSGNVDEDVSLEKDSKAMAELARNYHNELQGKDTGDDILEREIKIEKAVKSIKKKNRRAKCYPGTRVLRERHPRSTSCIKKQNGTRT